MCVCVYVYMYIYILIIFPSSSLIVRKEGLFYFSLLNSLNFILFIFYLFIDLFKKKNFLFLYYFIFLIF